MQDYRAGDFGVCACCGDETDVDQNSVCERCDAEEMREADESECEPKHQSRCEHGYCADCCGCA